MPVRPSPTVRGRRLRYKLRRLREQRNLTIEQVAERSGGDWVFVMAPAGGSAERRRIKVGRRTLEQLEILSGLAVGEQVITSDYSALEKTERVVLTH